MMLTNLPPRLLHQVRDAAAYVHDLAQLGLDLLCPCEDGHGARLLELGGHELGEQCYRPGCSGWVTGASDYCTPECENAARPHRFVNGTSCWCGAEHWRGEPVRIARLAGMVPAGTVRGFQ